LQLLRALSFIHRKGFIHTSLFYPSVMVKSINDSEINIKLSNFDNMTQILSIDDNDYKELLSENQEIDLFSLYSSLIYQSPEVVRNERDLSDR